MSAELLQLVSDTLNFLGRDLRIEVAPALPKQPLSKPAPKPVIKEKEPAPAAAPAPPLPAKTFMDKIKKHLPHLHLVQQIPTMRCVAILVSNQEDLPFLRNLKNAIEKHHCPVKILHEDALDWEQFELVISQRQVAAKRKILLESIAAYQNNTEQKKLLWSTICNMLSQKSS